MNFLAHIFLSGNSEGLMIGNYIADSVKGGAYKNYPDEIQKGILLHRKIDSFTDAHPVVEHSKQRLRERYRKYAGVIADVYYDHFLAVNFNDYSDIDLKTFTQNFYRIIKRNLSVMPEKSARFTQYMLMNDILFNYSTLGGIEMVLRGMARRTSFVSNMETAAEDLKEHFSLFEKEFQLFFPELQGYVKTQLII